MSANRQITAFAARGTSSGRIHDAAFAEILRDGLAGVAFLFGLGRAEDRRSPLSEQAPRSGVCNGHRGGVTLASFVSGGRVVFAPTANESVRAIISLLVQGITPHCDGYLSRSQSSRMASRVSARV